MNKIIKIPENLYGCLEKYAQGFDTPAQVIKRIVDFYDNNHKKITPLPIRESTNIQIFYFPDNNEENFKKRLIANKGAYIKLYKTNGENEIKTWSAQRLTDESSVDGNLRSGYLRGWRNKGIYKAELSIDEDDLQG